jgi:hypothetical protein
MQKLIHPNYLTNLVHKIYSHSRTACGRGAMVPYNAASATPPAETGVVVAYATAAQPICAAPYRALLPRAPPKSSMLKEEPLCLHDHLLWTLMLYDDLPMHFIDTKVVTAMDLDRQQNRFRFLTDGVMKRLYPLLTHEELEAANLLYDLEPRAKPPKQEPMVPEPEKNAVAANTSSSSQQEAP